VVSRLDAGLTIETAEEFFEQPIVHSRAARQWDRSDSRGAPDQRGHAVVGVEQARWWEQSP
jgi:hypothetical protein